MVHPNVTPTNFPKISFSFVSFYPGFPILPSKESLGISCGTFSGVPSGVSPKAYHEFSVEVSAGFFSRVFARLLPEFLAESHWEFFSESFLEFFKKIFYTGT